MDSDLVKAITPGNHPRAVDQEIDLATALKTLANHLSDAGTLPHIYLEREGVAPISPDLVGQS